MSKQQASKKTEQKKKTQIIEDRTFGLKNKNKSKKVQQQITSITKNVMNSGDPKQRKFDEQRKQAKVEAKARKKAAEEERNALFGEALLAVQKKGVGTNQKFGKIEAKGRDAEDETMKKQTSRAMKMMYQMDAQEMSEKLREDPNYVPTLEDEIEAERQKKVEELRRLGKLGTPVTAETFAAWKERKRLKRAADLKKSVDAELRKKKGGKGLGILSGRDLYEFKRDVFKDMDDEAEDGASVVDIDDDDDNEDLRITHTASAGLDTNGTLDKNLATKVQSTLFLEGDDIDLDDLDDDDYDE